MTRTLHNALINEARKQRSQIISPPPLPGGKIPIAILKEALDFFQDFLTEVGFRLHPQATRRGRGYEILTKGVTARRTSYMALVHIFWDVRKRKYFLHIPKQEVDRAALNYERSLDLEERHHLVLELHSKATLNSFFSATDDADEIHFDRYYGVAGCLDREPKLSFSYAQITKQAPFRKREKIAQNELFTAQRTGAR